jgi:hypothetical protein
MRTGKLARSFEITEMLRFNGFRIGDEQGPLFV